MNLLEERHANEDTAAVSYQCWTDYTSFRHSPGYLYVYTEHYILYQYLGWTNKITSTQWWKMTIHKCRPTHYPRLSAESFFSDPPPASYVKLCTLLSAHVLFRHEMVHAYIPHMHKQIKRITEACSTYYYTVIISDSNFNLWSSPDKSFYLFLYVYSHVTTPYAFSLKLLVIPQTETST